MTETKQDTQLPTALCRFIENGCPVEIGWGLKSDLKRFGYMRCYMTICYSFFFNENISGPNICVFPYNTSFALFQLVLKTKLALPELIRKILPFP